MNIKTVIFISECGFALGCGVTTVLAGIPVVKRVFRLDKKKPQETTPSNDITEDETREDDEK